MQIQVLRNKFHFRKGFLWNWETSFQVPRNPTAFLEKSTGLCWQIQLNGLINQPFFCHQLARGKCVGTDKQANKQTLLSKIFLLKKICTSVILAIASHYLSLLSTIFNLTMELFLLSYWGHFNKLKFLVEPVHFILDEC